MLEAYSFGIIIHEIFAKGEILANPQNNNGSCNMSNVEMRRQQNITASANRYPKSIPETTRVQIANLVNSCLKLNPDQRISDQEAIIKIEEIQRGLN